MQVVRVQQDMEQEARTRTGRTGALPHIGVGWYRMSFDLPAFSKGKNGIANSLMEQ
jgi:beta-galactosidase